MSDIYLGNTEIEKAYIGDTLIYEKGGGGGGEESNDYEFMGFDTSNGLEFEAPLQEKNLLIYITNTGLSTKTIKVVNSSTSKYFTYSIPKIKSYWFICQRNSKTIYVSAGTTTTIT
jgi:hypothetical protein